MINIDIDSSLGGLKDNFHLMDKKKIGIILEFGFHDLKKYVYSDFGQELQRHFDIVWLAIQKNSHEFHRLFSETGYPIVYFNESDFIISSKIESRNLSVRRAWMSNNSIELFHTHKRINIGYLRRIVLGNNLVKKIYEIKTLKHVYSKYYNNKLAAVIKNHDLKQIFGTVYSSVFSKSAFVTGHKLGLTCHLLINSHKDLYINNFIPFKFLTSIFVWDENMKADCISQMTYLSPRNIVVSGNPVFDSLRKSKPKYDRQYYSKKYKINSDASWILYTMMSPLAGFNEIEVVKLIGNALTKSNNHSKPIILLRRNPQHRKEDFEKEHLPKNIVLTDHYSYFDSEKDLNVQSPEGEQEWIDLLHHCSLNISVPSTVTLEFLALNKPVVNIGFGISGQPDPVLKQYLEAAFNKPLMSSEKVFSCSTLELCIERIRMALDAEFTECQGHNYNKESSSNIIIKRLKEY